VLQWCVCETVDIRWLGIVEWIELGALGSVPECFAVHVLVLPVHFPPVGTGGALVELTIVSFVVLSWPGAVRSFGLSIHSKCISICAQLAGSRRLLRSFCSGWSGPRGRPMTKRCVRRKAAPILFGIVFRIAV